MTSSNSILFTGLLVLCALISKQFLLINEETLVALCFCVFVFAAIRFGGGMVQGMIEAQQDEISQNISQGSLSQLEALQARLETSSKIQDALATFHSNSSGLQTYLDSSLEAGYKKDQDWFSRLYEGQIKLLGLPTSQETLRTNVPQLVRELILLNPSVPSVLLSQSFASLQVAKDAKKGRSGPAFPPKKVVL